MPNVTYGVVVTNPTHRDGGVTEAATAQTPLLGEAESSSDGAVHPKELNGVASITSSTGNLANTILGTGVLAFPMAMASSGLLPGLFTCLFSGAVAAFGLHLLGRCASQTPHRRSSFFAVAQLTYPSFAIVFDAAIAIKCFGVSVSYLIIIKNLMPSVVKSLHHVSNTSSELPWWAVSGTFWITVFMAVLIPLCFLRRLDSLRHTSYIALFSVAYLVIIVIYCHFHPPKGSEERGEWHLIRFTPNFISTFPVQVFAFTCAQNLFPIYNELVSNTQERIDIVIATALGSATLTYEVISIFGYITFGANVGPNIIAMYPSTTVFIALGQFAIVVLVLFSYPLQVHPCRNCLDKVFSTKAAPFQQVSSSSADSDDEEEEEDQTGHGSVDMSHIKFTVITSAIIVATYSIAFLVDDLRIVLSFVGSTGSTTISFILPGLFYFKLFGSQPGHSKAMKWSSVALCIYGVLIFVFCLTYNIYKVIHP